MPFRFEPLDLLLIALAALLIFGPSRLPEIGRALGQTIREFQRATRGTIENLRQEAGEPARAEPPGAEVASPAVQSADLDRCTRCGASNPPGARFCNKCGTQLRA